MGFKERAAQRRKKIVAHVAHSHEEAEREDLEFWQSQSPQDRLSAAAVLSEAVEKVMRRLRAQRQVTRGPQRSCACSHRAAVPSSRSL